MSFENVRALKKELAEFRAALAECRAALAEATRKEEAWRTSWAESEGELRFVEEHEDGLKSKCQKLFRLLDRNTNPGAPVDPDSGECYYCEYGIHDCEYQGDDDWLALPAGHKPECAWRQAREFIEKETGDVDIAPSKKKCGHGPEMLKVVDLYCAQCVEEAK